MLFVVGPLPCADFMNLYAARAVQFHPNVVRFDFVWPSARAPHAHREPFNFTPTGFNSISFQLDFVWLSPHVRPMGRTRGEPNKIRKNVNPTDFTRLQLPENVDAKAVIDLFL